MPRTPRPSDGRIEVKRKPKKCPRCSAKRVARVEYGFMAWSPDIEAGRVVVGGCDITPPKPSWRCTRCETDIYKQEAR